MFVKTGILLALVAVVLASPAYDFGSDPEAFDSEDLAQYVPLDDIVEYKPLYLVRARRQIEFNPHINKQDGTTNAGATVTHKGDNHEVTGHWNKNIRGPARAKPNYGVRGSFKW